MAKGKGIKVWVEYDSKVILYVVPPTYLEKVIRLISEYECKPDFDKKKSDSGNGDQ